MTAAKTTQCPLLPTNVRSVHNGRYSNRHGPDKDSAPENGTTSCKGHGEKNRPKAIS